MRASIPLLVLAAACATGPRPADPGVPDRGGPARTAGDEIVQLDPAPLDEATATAFAELALSCVHREYPNKIAHVLERDEDARPPRELTPAFYGCFDWHSAVHGHWLLARLARRFPEAELAPRARSALGRSLTPDAIAGEVAYLGRDGRAGFERPYGLAWLLQLAAELREWDDPDARRWSEALAPLVEVVAGRFRDWLPKLGHPIRSGEHSQTAFAMGLVLDWARGAGDGDMIGLIERRAAELHAGDRGCAIHLEPSGHDFLSPCLGAADLMRRVMDAEAFADWLGRALPGIPRDGAAWLEPAVPSDRVDGKLVHLDGLNLSRAWMLEGIASGLPAGDPRMRAIVTAAGRHREAGLSAVSGEHYSGAHWLGSFATYLTTRRGVTSGTSY